MRPTKRASMIDAEGAEPMQFSLCGRFPAARRRASRAFFVMAASLSAVIIATATQADAATGVTLLSTPGADRFDRNNTFGWRFTPTVDIDVSSLGYFDVESIPGGSGTGLTQSHDVGIFRLDTTLVASVTVPAGTAGTLLSNYRYADLAAPLRLSAGSTYIIGAFYLSTSLDAMPGVTNFAFPPEITYSNVPAPTPQNPLNGTAVYIVNIHGNPPSGLSCPLLALNNLLPIFAANFQFATACPLAGDMNMDGKLDADDIQAFVNCTLAGGGPTGNCACANLSPAQFIARLLQ